MLRYKTQTRPGLVQISRLVRHPARKRTGSILIYNPGSRTGRQTRVLRPFDSSGGRSQQRNAATKGHKQYSELQKRKFNPTVNRKPSNHPISYRQQSTTITNKIHKRKPETRQNLRHCLASANHNSSSCSRRWRLL